MLVCVALPCRWRRWPRLGAGLTRRAPPAEPCTQPSNSDCPVGCSCAKGACGLRVPHSAAGQAWQARIQELMQAARRLSGMFVQAWQPALDIRTLMVRLFHPPAALAFNQCVSSVDVREEGGLHK